MEVSIRSPEADRRFGERVRRINIDDVPQPEDITKSGVMLEEPTVADKPRRPANFKITQNLRENMGAPWDVLVVIEETKWHTTVQNVDRGSRIS